MHLEATCDLRDGEQLDLVALPIAEQLEDSLSDGLHERQVESWGHCPVIRRAHLDALQLTSELSRQIGHYPCPLYGNGAYCAFLPHTVCPCFATVNPLRCGPRPGGLRWWPVSPEPVPSREALESQARRLLELARERTGASVERMVKTFGDLQPRGAVTRRSWYDWQERPETVSLLTGLAAMHALGPEASMELLFGEAAGAVAGVDSATRDDRMDQLQTAVEDAMTELMQLRERVEGFVVPELQRQGELLATVLADGTDAGASEAAEQQTPEDRGRAAER
jgi:hypothetical protein